MVKKRLLILALSVSILSSVFGLSVLAKEYKSSKLRDAVAVAEQYEGNIVFLLSGGYWEAPIENYEIEPDAPLGIYEKTEVSQELLDKYSMYLELSAEAGILDSGVSSEDVEAYVLTSEEKLSLSTIEFSYYYDYNNDYLLQLYEISWIDGGFSRGCVMWSNTNVFNFIKFQ